MSTASCHHLADIQTVRHAARRVCEECIKTGAGWVHLRTCQACGITLCCDSSPNKHASKHSKLSKHPVVASAEPGEQWLYCYPDNLYADY
jgi:hypothetical protein